MKLPCLPTSRLILAVSLMCSALPIVSHATPSTFARLENSLSGSVLGYGVVGTPENRTSTYQVTGVSDSEYDGNMVAEGFATAGVVGTNAHIDFHGSNPNSGTLGARAGASFYETMDVTVPAEFTINNLAYWVLVYHASAQGGVGASGTKTEGGHGLASASADIGYDFTFGSSYRTGSRGYSSSDNSSSNSGSWGSLSGSTAVGAGGSVYLSMSGVANAFVANAYNYGERTASADAVFGSTLIWEGIVGVSAFNTSGQLIELPDDFHLNLIGRESGFNYWNAAVHPNAPVGVPDSGSAMLMLVPALFGLALVQRRWRTAVGC